MSDIPSDINGHGPHQEDVNKSNAYWALFGRFQTGASSVPYAVFNMTLSQAASDLVIPEEAAPVSIEGTRVTQLYQRDIDWDRVMHRLVPYLKNANTDHFFSAITVTLLPYRAGEFVGYKEGGLAAPAAYNGKPSTKLGSLTLTALDGRAPSLPEVSHAVLQWNKDQMRAVAIDGQHRLGALKVLLAENHPELNSSKITVVAVIPAEELGYRGEGGAPYELMRKLFTDLNTYAVKVDETRQILLDDRDPFRLCVRAIMAEEFHATDGRNESYDRVPFPLVDWHTGDPKVEGGPYLVSVQTLQGIVKDLINANAVTNWADQKSVESQVNSLREFGWVPSDECEARLQSLRDLGENSPFAYPSRDLLEIQEAFRKKWGAAIVAVMMELAEYRRVLDARRAVPGGLSPAFTQWYSATHRVAAAGDDAAPQLTRAVQGIRAMLLNQEPPISPDSFEELMTTISRAKGSSLAYKIVFQKAMFMALKTLSSYPAIDPDEPDANGPLAWARRMIAALNTLSIAGDGDFFDKDFADEQQRYFWMGSCRNSDGSIDHKAAAARRTQWWLVLATLMHYGLVHIGDHEFRITSRTDIEHINSGERANPFVGPLGTRYRNACRQIFGYTNQRAMYKAACWQKENVFEELENDEAEALLWSQYFKPRLRLLYSRLGGE